MSEPQNGVLVGLYPGTFDPVTNGHLDVIGRAARMFSRLVVGVAVNAGKAPLLPIEERVELVQAELAAVKARTGVPVEVRPFDCLLIHFAQLVGARVIVRGLRAVSDFDYEFQMAGMNYRLDSGDRDGVPDGERAASVHRLAAGEGGRVSRRRHRQLRPAADA